MERYGFGGLFRGRCVDNRDPLGMGRIRVQVPQTMGDRASGWAFPAYPVGDLGIWPEDRLPEPGQGVWVQFESRDRLTWMMIYGDEEPSLQPLDDLVDSYVPTVTMLVPAMPVGVEVTVAGEVGSVVGAPIGASMGLERSPDGLAPWTEVGTATVGPLGEWSVEHTEASANNPQPFFRARVDPLAPWGSYDGEPPADPADWDTARTQPTYSPVAQPLDPDRASDLVWDLDPADVAWKGTVRISGVLSDTATGRGLPDRTVRIYVRETGGGSWRTESGWSGTTDRQGAWSIDWTRVEELIPEMEIRALFLGDADYQYVSSTTQTLPLVSFPTTTTWTPPTITQVGQQVTFTGRTVVTGTSGRVPSGTVRLERRVPSGADPWEAVGTATPATDGTWTVSHTVAVYDADFRVRSPAVYVYQESASPTLSFDLATDTQTGATVAPGSMIWGNSPQFTGTVTTTGGVPVTTGQVRLQRYLVAAPAPAWEDDPGSGPVAVDAQGAYSITRSAIDWFGDTRWRAHYLGDPYAGLAECTGPHVQRTIPPPPPWPIKGALTHTSASFQWSASPAPVSGYEVFKQPFGQPWESVGTTTNLTYTVTGLAHDSLHQFAVVSLGTDAGGNPVPSVFGYGALSWAHTGQPEIRNTGSFERTETPIATGSWRPSDGWATHTPKVAQGWAIASSNDAYGTITYDGLAFRSWVTSTYGTDVLAALSAQSAWTRSRLKLTREPNVGYTTVTPIMWVSPTIAGQGGQPPIAGAEGLLGSFAFDASNPITKTLDLRLPWWGRHVLLNDVLPYYSGATNSLVMHSNNSAMYARFYHPAGSAGSCDLTVNCAWDFQVQAYVAPSWAEGIPIYIA